MIFSSVAASSGTVASSSTVLANLAYLIGAVVVAALIGVLIWLRHRPPKSVDANMASFRRGLSALAPDPEFEAKAAAAHEEQSRARPVPTGQVHVKVEDPAPDGTPVEGSQSG